MRTLNVRLAAILFVVVIVIIGSAHLLHSFQLQRHSKAFKAAAEAAWNDNPRRVGDALQLMRGYLAVEPFNLEARQQLGFWYAESGYFPSASTTLEEVLRALEKQSTPNPETIRAVRTELIDCATAQGRCADAAYHLEILKKELPNDVDLLNKLGKCQITLGREQDAIDNFGKAIKLRPDRIDIYYNKAMALRFPPVQKLPEAEACMAQMIAYDANAKSAGAHHVYGMWLTELGKFDKAPEQALLTLKLKKDHPGGLYLAGQCELQSVEKGHFERAAEYARRGIAAAPQDFAMHTLLAEILVRDNQRDQAIEVLKNGVKTCASRAAKSQILWHLANLYLDGRNGVDAKSIADAEDCMRSMREYHYSSVQMAFLDTRVLYANDDWRMALEGFERIRPKLSDFPQLLKCLDYWIGYCYMQQGNPDQAMASFRRALSFDKFYFKAHDGIAQIFTSNSQLKDAAEEYRQAAIGAPNDGEAWVAWARSLVLRNLRSKATDEDWNEVGRVLQNAEKVAPLNGQIQLIKAEILIAHGKPDAAEALLGALHKDSPSSMEFEIARANFFTRIGQLQEAKKVLETARIRIGDRAMIRLAQAVIYLRETGLGAGAELEKLAGGVDSYSPEEKIRLWNGLLSNFMEIRDYDRAKTVCRQLARLQPKDATIRYRLFELAMVTHDARDPTASLAELDGVLEEIDNLAGQGPLYMYGKSVRLKIEAEHGKPELWDSAMDYAIRAQKMRLAWSRPHVLQGEICRQRGDNEAALQHYMQASVNGDRDLDFLRLLLQMLFERQRYQEAEQVIRRLDSDQTPLTPALVKTEAEIFSIRGNFDRELECTNRAYNAASDDYRDHVWHGQVLKILARRAQQEGHQNKLPEIAAEAEKSLRQAIRLAPNAADSRVELVQLLAMTNKMDSAYVAADDARQMIPSDVAPLAMGYIYEALNDMKTARQSYEKALRLRPDQPLTIRVLADFYVRNQDIPRAAPLVEKLLASEAQSSEIDLIWARRMKATILARQGYPKLKEALELIDQNLNSPLASSQDKRVKIRLLLLDPRRARSRETLELLEGLVNTSGPEPSLDDRFSLAQLYLLRGDWDNCRSQMQKLINAGQTNLTYNSAYVRMLLDHDELEDAGALLDRLEKASNPGAAVALRAEFLYREKKWGEVPGYLADYVEQDKAIPKDRLHRMLIAARLLEDLGSGPNPTRELAANYFNKAREYYEAVERKRPGSEMVLADFHAKHGSVDEAISRIEKFGDKTDPQSVGVVVQSILTRSAISDAQRKRLETVVIALADKTKRPAQLLYSLAEIQAALDHLPAAESIYRELIAKEPENYLFCNNLSMILALQKTKLDEALDLINKAINQAGPVGALLDTRAIVWIARQEPQKALEDLDAALAEKITPTRLFHQAWAQHEAGADSKAKELLQSARNDTNRLDDVRLSASERAVKEELMKIE